jgi:replicative DNA helicase
LASALARAYDALETRSAGIPGLTGVPTGFPALDGIIGGWQAGQLTALAGVPGVGTSSLLLTFAREAAIRGQRPTLLVSVDSSEAEVVERLITAESATPFPVVASAALRPEDWERFAASVQEMRTAPLYIDDQPKLTCFELIGRVIQARNDLAIELVLIDRGDLLTSTTWSAADGDAFLGRELKHLATRINLPVVVTCRLGSDPDPFSGHRPSLARLRRTDHTLEEAADVVLLLHRDAMYGHGHVYDDADITVAKHTRGQLGTVTASSQLQYRRFAAMPSRPQDPIRELLSTPPDGGRELR